MKRKTNKNKSGRVSYNEERDSNPSKQTGDMINDRNNNENTADPSSNEPDVQRANDTGLGDAGVNRNKMTKFRSNRSMDA